MKSLAELEQIRKATMEKINLRREDKAELTRVVIGMATCGIAAGARPVMLAFMDERPGASACAAWSPWWT